MSEPDNPSATDAEPPAGLGARDLKTAAQKLAQPALDTLEAIMKGQGQDAVRLAAAREVLDRGYGRTAPKASRSKRGGGGAPYTVVVRRFSDPPEEGLEDFE